MKTQMRFLLIFFLLPLHIVLSQERPTLDDIESVIHFEKERAKLKLKDHSQEGPENTRYNGTDITFYDLDLRIDDDKSFLQGNVIVEGKSTKNNLTTISLDLHTNLYVDSIAGNIASFTHENDVISIQLAQPLNENESFQCTIFYEGVPLGGGFGGFEFSQQNGNPLIWTLSEPYYARSWWPCKDIPNDKADSVNITVTVSENLTAVSNGLLKKVEDNGDGTRTFFWQERYPITTYLVSLAITNYRTFSQWFRYSETDSMEVTHYVYPESFETARNDLSNLVDMIEFFHNTFGPYPFIKEKYGIAQFGWRGGMEHQTISSQGGFGQTLNAHELAHQWWGDMITTANWPEIWMNEGFAAYSEALFFEHAIGEDYYHEYMATKSNRYNGSIYRADTTDVRAIFDRIVYDKGAWVLHMLRRVVGDDTFFAILRQYAADARFTYGNTTTARFQQLCEEIYGADLNWFFQQWIFGTGRPHYRFEWETTADQGHFRTELFLEQIQIDQHQVFAMPIEILLEGNAADTTVTIFFDKDSAIFDFTTTFEPHSLTIDPENWVLKDVSLPDTSVFSPPADNRFRLFSNYPNPFNEETRIDIFLPTAVHQMDLKIYNIRGQLIQHFAKINPATGLHTFHWNGTASSGKKVESGVYVYHLKAAPYQSSRKLLFIK